MGAEPIVVLIAFKIQPGKESLATQVMTSLIGTVRKQEPACSGITMIRDAADPTRVLLYELWPDRDSYMARTWKPRTSRRSSPGPASCSRARRRSRSGTRWRRCEAAGNTSGGFVVSTAVAVVCLLVISPAEPSHVHE